MSKHESVSGVPAPSAPRETAKRIRANYEAIRHDVSFQLNDYTAFNDFIVLADELDYAAGLKVPTPSAFRVERVEKDNRYFDTENDARAFAEGFENDDGSIEAYNLIPLYDAAVPVPTPSAEPVAYAAIADDDDDVLAVQTKRFTGQEWFADVPSWRIVPLYAAAASGSRGSATDASHYGFTGSLVDAITYEICEERPEISKTAASDIGRAAVDKIMLRWARKEFEGSATPELNTMISEAIQMTVRSLDAQRDLPRSAQSVDYAGIIRTVTSGSATPAPEPTVAEMHDNSMLAIDRGDMRTALVLETQALARAVKKQVSHATIGILLKSATAIAKDLRESSPYPPGKGTEEISGSGTAPAAPPDEPVYSTMISTHPLAHFVSGTNLTALCGRTAREGWSVSDQRLTLSEWKDALEGVSYMCSVCSTKAMWRIPRAEPNPLTTESQI